MMQSAFSGLKRKDRVNRVVNYSKNIQRVTCVVMAALFLALACVQDTFATPTAAGENMQAQQAFLDEWVSLPQGIAPPPELSLQAVAKAQLSGQELQACMDGRTDFTQAQRQLEADLMQRYGDQTEGTQVSADAAGAETVSENGAGAVAVPENGEGSAAVSVNDAQWKISPEQLGYATIEDAVDYVRGQMVKRKEDITVRLAKGRDTDQRKMKTLLEQCFAHEADSGPKEGDYLYWNFRSYSWGIVEGDYNPETVTYYINISWRSDASEEKYVDKKIAEAVSRLDLKNGQKSEYEKVKQIYDYIMDTLTYDYYHYEVNQNYMPMYTVYGALHDGTGVCQAYALLFYRLCREVGIDARLISGNDDGEGNATHGWNIVRIGENYYNVDATWDDEMVSRRRYFLKNKADFTGHTRHKTYKTQEFEKQFPLSQVSYRTPNAIRHRDDAVAFTAKENLQGTLSTSAGGSFSLSSGGKYKIVYFVNLTEAGSTAALTSMKEWTGLNQADCEIALVDVTSDQDYIQYMSSHKIAGDAADYEKRMAERVLAYLGKPSNVVYILSANVNEILQNNYAVLMGGTAGGICSGVLIDPDNKVRCWSEGAYSAAAIENALATLRSESASMARAGALKVKQTANHQVTVKWNGMAAADRYYIYRKKGTGGYACVGTTKKTEYVNLIPGKGTYQYKVYAWDGTRFFAIYDETAVKCKTIYAKKGKTYQSDGCRYKVIKSSASARTVAFMGVTSKNVKAVRIPDSVVIDGLTYKVTEISGQALKGKKKLKTVSIGKNVTKIGKNAFYGCRQLVQIVVQGKKVTSVGSNAFQGTGSKANIYVPASSLGKYRKLFAGKGLSKDAKIKK